MKNNYHTYYSKYIQIVVLFLIVVSGVFYVRNSWIAFEKERNDKILHIGRSIAEVLPRDIIKALDAKPSDVDKPSYKALKKILSSLTSVNDHSTFAYIFSQRNGKLYFMADSEPEGSQAGSPAGQEYFEATPIDKQLFDDASVPVIERSSDRWGKWVSVLVPVKDDVSGKTIALFGMDFEREAWDKPLLFQIAQSSVVVLLLLIAFLFLIVIKKTNLRLKEDLDKRIRAETALKESQSLYLSFIEQLPNPVFRKDSEGCYVLVNSQFCKLKGLKMEDIIGNNSLKVTSKEIEVLGEQWQEAVYTNVDEDIHQQILKTGSLYQTEEVYPAAGGGLKYMLVVRMPVVDSNGVIIGSQGIMFDISDLKRTEQELIKSKEKAEESNRLKSAFLTNLSHEIRTPMSSLLGFSELLKDPDISGEQQQFYFQNMEQSGLRLLKTLNDIICISKIESGQVSVSITDTDINEQLREVYNHFKPEAEQKGLDFRIKNPLIMNQVILKTDGEKIKAILSYLVSNALKFTRVGSIEIEYIQRQNELEFRVRDTGAGVRPELKTTIFENFRQGSDAYTRDYEGAGLGLSISKAYVEMLGGKIWVESEDGKGATFLFTVLRQKG